MQQRINLTILATYPLVQAYLEVLFKNEKAICITDMAGSPTELVEIISRRQPDICMLCVMKDEINNIGLIPDLLLDYPKTRFVILIEPSDQYDQMEALKMGAAAVVEMNQTVQTLIRAIKQVFEGGTWFNQKLINRLMDPDASSRNSKNGTYSDGLTKREYEIINVILLGMSNRQISKKLAISEATVRHHLSTIYSKLSLEDRLNLVIYAYQNGLVQNGANKS